MWRNFYKSIIQIFVYLFEIIFITSILVCLTSILEPCNTIWSYVERYILCYGLYQFIIFIILSNINDVKKDSYLALLSCYKLCDLYLENNSKLLLEKINTIIEAQLEKSTLNYKKINNEYEELREIITTKNIDALKVKMIFCEHSYEESNLNWKYSILLRLIK